MFHFQSVSKILCKILTLLLFCTLLCVITLIWRLFESGYEYAWVCLCLAFKQLFYFLGGFASLTAVPVYLCCMRFIVLFFLFSFLVLLFVFVLYVFVSICFVFYVANSLESWFALRLISWMKQSCRVCKKANIVFGIFGGNLIKRNLLKTTIFCFSLKYIKNLFQFNLRRNHNFWRRYNTQKS